MGSQMNCGEELLEDGALTIDQAVSWSGVGRTQLYGEMANGNLPFVQKGARRLIPRKALRRLLAEGLVSGNRNSFDGE